MFRAGNRVLKLLIGKIRRVIISVLLGIVGLLSLVLLLTMMVKLILLSVYQVFDNREHCSKRNMKP